MDLLELLAAAQGGKAYANVGRQFGLDEVQTQQAINALAPVLAAGVRKNMAQERGYDDLMSALSDGHHQNFFDDERAVQYDNVMDEGNRMLGHVLGSKEASREVANYAAAQTGIGASILKKMLPVVISMILGSLTKGMAGGSQPRQQQGGGGLGDIIGDILGGGAGQQPQTGGRQQQGGGGLGDIIGDILGGGASGGSKGGGRQSPGGFGDILREVLGGGAGGSSGGGGVQYDVNEKPDFNIDETVFRQDPQRGREVLDDFLGRGSDTGTAADDLLNSVERATRGR
ncbi:MAG: DUF937 domain-containing protein [Hyphomicrobiales bacterium]